MTNSKVVIENAQVVLENGIIWDGAILIMVHGKILKCGIVARLTKNITRLLLTN